MSVVRRSSRSTKGVHSKRLETEYDEPTSATASTEASADARGTGKKEKGEAGEKPKRQKKRQPSWVEIPGETVRCLVCGTTDLDYNEEDEDPHGMMIQCESCNTWQHVKCLLGKIKEKDIPEHYKCDICDPTNPAYANLRRKMSYARYLTLRLPKGPAEKEDGNEGDQGEEEYPPEVDAGAIDVDANDGEYMESKGKTKNNHSDDELSEDNEAKTSDRKSIKKSVKRVRSVQSPDIKKDNKTKKPKPNYTVDSIRSKIVKNLELKLVELLPKVNNEKILDGRSVGEVAKNWAEILEGGVFKLYPNFPTDQPKYTDKVRRLLINLKISRLIERVINGEFTIEQLPTLTSEDMRTEEEKRKAEEAKQHAINQVVIKQEVSTLPKTRLTHRGEEIIGDTDYQFDVNDRRIEEVEKLKESRDQQRSLSEKSTELKQNDSESNTDTMKLTSATPLCYNHNDDNDHSIDNSNMEGNTRDESAPGDDLLDDDLFQNILHDDVVKKKTSMKSKAETQTATDLPPSPQGSPDSETTKSDIGIWEGVLNAPDYSVKCQADFIASTCKNTKRDTLIERARRILEEASLSNNNEITTKGRLNSAVADAYLDKITNTRDLYLYEIRPFDLEDEESVKKFYKIWEFYHSVSKYAVLKNTLSYVKDSYLLSFLREKMIDNEEASIIMGKFNLDEIFEHLQNSDENCKIYVVFVVQRNIDSTRDPIPEGSTAKTDTVNPTVNETGGLEKDDYDPAISMTLSKLSSDSSGNSSTPDFALANLMQNLG